MKRTSPSCRLLTSAARSPARSSAGPLVTRMPVPSSAAMIIASEVLPGQERRTEHGPAGRPRRGAHQHQLRAAHGRVLPDELVEPPRPQRRFDQPLVLARLGRDLRRHVLRRSSAAAQHGRPFAQQLRYVGIGRASGCALASRTTASSAEEDGKPSPTRACESVSRQPGCTGTGAAVVVPITLSLSSSTIRCAPLRPMPGTRVSAARSSVRSARRCRACARSARPAPAADRHRTPSAAARTARARRRRRSRRASGCPHARPGWSPAPLRRRPAAGRGCRVCLDRQATPPTRTTTPSGCSAVTVPATLAIIETPEQRAGTARARATGGRSPARAHRRRRRAGGGRRAGAAGRPSARPAPCRPGPSR